MKKRVIQIKESDLNKLVERLVNENHDHGLIDVELKGDSTKIKATKKQFKDFMNEPGCSILGKMPDLRPEDIKKIKKAFPKNPLNEAEMLSEGVLLNEGIKDKLKSMISKMASSFIRKIGDNGEEVYEKLVAEFGENPSLSDIKDKLSSSISINEDVGVGEYDEIVGKDGKTTLLDKIMSRIQQIIGINLMSFGVVPSGLALFFNANTGQLNSGIVYMVGSYLISFIMMGLHSEYKAHRKGEDSYFKSGKGSRGY